MSACLSTPVVLLCLTDSHHQHVKGNHLHRRQAGRCTCRHGHTADLSSPLETHQNLTKAITLKVKQSGGLPACRAILLTQFHRVLCTLWYKNSCSPAVFPLMDGQHITSSSGQLDMLNLLYLGVLRLGGGWDGPHRLIFHLVECLFPSSCREMMETRTHLLLILSKVT